MASGKVATHGDDVLVGCLSAWDDVEALLGPSDEGDVSAQEAKGQFSGVTAQMADPLRAAGPAGGEAQGEPQRAVAEDDAGGESDVSDELTL